MFSRTTEYPKAVSSGEDGVAAAINWCRQHLPDGETLSVWTHLKSNLEANSELSQLVQKYSNVTHITRRGGGSPRQPGPVLMAWADMDDIADLLRFGSSAVRALCIIAWDVEGLRPWVAAAQPEILGDPSGWSEPFPSLHPVMAQALHDLTRSINHNNTLAGGYEKDDVVSTLLALHDANIPLNAKAMQGWAVANGWTGDNPAYLAKYATDIAHGKRPRARRTVRDDYVDYLRARAAARDNDSV